MRQLATLLNPHLRAPLLTRLLFLPLVAVLPLVLPFEAYADDASSTEASRRAAEMALKELKPIQDRIEQAAKNELAVLNHVTTDVRAFLEQFGDMRKMVEQHVQAYVEDPTKENKGHLHRAVSQAAVQAVTACRGLVASRKKIHDLTQTIVKGLDTSIDEAAELRADAQGHATALHVEARKLMAVAKRTRDALVRSGAKGPEDLTPEMADRLFRLQVDLEAGALMAELWDEIAQQVEGYVLILEATKEDYQVVDRVVGQVAYKADSMEDVFELIAKLEHVHLHLGLQTLEGHSHEIRTEITACFDDLSALTGAAHGLRAAMQRAPGTVRRSSDSSGESRPGNQRLWDWAMELGQDQHESKAKDLQDKSAPVATSR